jgi:hypothetical protein
MTPREWHDAQKAMIRASLLLADTRADRHGVYAKRRKPALRPVPPRAGGWSPGGHVWTMPVVNEKTL